MFFFSLQFFIFSGEAVQALRKAFESLEKLQSCADGLGPPKAHILQALGDESAALDILEAIDSCRDRSSGAIRLHSQVRSDIQKHLL
jgi:hypothetical protein